MKVIIYLVTLLTIFACASGKINYTPPIQPEKKLITTKTVDLTYNKTWDKLIESLSESVYTIEHMNKDSGFINIAFTHTNPKDVLDCGTFYGFFKNARVDDKYSFNGARPYMRYNVFNNNALTPMERKAKLSGKINLYIKKISSKKTQLKVSIKYNLAVRTIVQYMQGYNWASRLDSYDVLFSSNQEGIPSDHRDLRCYNNGKLEEYFLNLI